MKYTRSKKREMRIKRWIEAAGSVMTLIGLGGLGGASEGHGSFIISVALFSVGFAIVLWGYER